jgi:lipid A 3-O-deacylase
MYLKKYYFLLLLLFVVPMKSEGEEVLKKNSEYSVYGGTFDTIDKEGDDQATLYGFEHNNPFLFRDTFVGRFSPITGGFITDKKSVYLYTGVEAQYAVGPLNIIPSFAPGYYEPGDGKDFRIMTGERETQVWTINKFHLQKISNKNEVK